jgi:putative peptidoglycan lipid II flippase
MKKIVSSIFSPQESISVATFVLVAAMLLSRLLGLLRDRLLASYFLPSDLGVYLAAFRIPNLLFELIVMGAFTIAFIPVFTRYILKNQKEDAILMSSILVNITTIMIIIVLIPLLLFAPYFCRLFAPGFTEQELIMMTSFTRLMLVFQVIPLMLGNYFTGILQSYKYFLIPSLAPVLYNVGVIFGIVVFSQSFGLYAPVIGTAIGAGLFFLIHLPFVIHLGYRHRFAINIKNLGVREVLKLMIPRTIGLGVSQIDSTVDLILSSLLGPTMVTVFNFAQHLQYMPVGLFGATLSQAVLPTLSRYYANNNRQSYQRILFSSLLQVLFLLLPVTAFFLVLRIPIVRLVFGGDRFDWEATVLTAHTLSFFALSIPSQAFIPILARGFYAACDSKTPMILSIINVIFNAVLSYLFVVYYHLPIWSLGLSATLAYTIQVVLLTFMLIKKQHLNISKEIIQSLLKMFVATLCMIVTLYIPLKLFDQLVFDTTRTFGLFMLTATSSLIGFGTYLIVAWMLGVEEISSYVEIFKRIQSKMMTSEVRSEIVSQTVDTQ